MTGVRAGDDSLGDHGADAQDDIELAQIELLHGEGIQRNVELELLARERQTIHERGPDIHLSKTVRQRFRTVDDGVDRCVWEDLVQRVGLDQLKLG